MWAESLKKSMIPTNYLQCQEDKKSCTKREGGGTKLTEESISVWNMHVKQRAHQTTQPATGPVKLSTIIKQFTANKCWLLREKHFFQKEDVQAEIKAHYCP